MARINDTERLIREIMLLNIVGGRKGLAITPLLSGQHGIGKTFIMHSAAEKLGGVCLTVEGGSLKEGEITGLPFASPKKDGSTEVRFVPYFIISAIQDLQKEIYTRALEGLPFNGGSVKIDLEKNVTIIKKGAKTTELPRMSENEMILNGEINRYAFGDDLPGDIKLALIESGSITPVLLFIDEMNRTEQQTMKELMNIVLNKNVNGYDIPWWVNMASAINPSSQGSVYATNEIDDAQRDRFLKIKVDANLDEWIDYALKAGINDEVISAIATAEDIFIDKQKGYEDTDEMKPSPRSWEMVAVIYDSLRKVLDTQFFNVEDRKKYDDDLRTLISAKVGINPARTLIETIKNAENDIKASEIINGKAPEIPGGVVTKFKRQRKLRQKITADRVIHHICKVLPDFKAKRKSQKAADKMEWANFTSQLKQFVNLMDNATQLDFAKKLSATTCVDTEGKPVFGDVATCFAKELFAQLVEFNSDLKKTNNE